MLDKYQDKLFISVPEMAEILGISVSQAYVFIKAAPFNYVYVGERRIVIPTNSFFGWYKSLETPVENNPETPE